MNIDFPEYNSNFDKTSNLQYHRYYNTHFKYVRNLLGEAGCNVKLVPASNFENYSRTCFEMKVNGVLVAIDFSDHLKVSIPEDKIKKYAVIFKFHYNHDLHSGYKNMYPFSPVNFQSWSLYKKAIANVNYKASGLILCKQQPGGAALERRKYVQGLLHVKYGNMFDKSIQPEFDFYMKINQALVSVCVPGARNDMLDRGQGQYLALGCCTISPKLVTVLSFNQQLVPGTHYIECKPDYSDVVEKVEWVRSNPEKAIQIGKNAKQIFEKTSLPKIQVEWINKCLKNE
jgi:hypothetical protein